jgi:cell division septum initiation protein DivIVA
MKFETETPPDGFKPITLKLTFHIEKELNDFLDLINIAYEAIDEPETSKDGRIKQLAEDIIETIESER